MTTYVRSIREHYGRVDFKDAILSALGHDAKVIQALTRDDLRALDEFHIRGKKATQELALRAGIRSGMKVLDIGCGIGGPARTLATEFGCHVTGIDIVEEYCEVAALLTYHVGLSDRVQFQCADISALPVGDGEYDVVWSQHVLMNIDNKRTLFREVRRILRPSGIYAFFEICTGSLEPPYFPVPWASDQSIHFPVGSDALRTMLREAFQEKEWRDISAESLDWYRKTIAKEAQHQATEPPALGLHLLMGPATRQKMANVVRNLEEDRIRVVQGVMTKEP